MLFTKVIFSTYKFFQEPLANITQAYSFFVTKKGVVWCLITLNNNGLTKFKNIFLLKELFFTSPQLKITLFKAVFIQPALNVVFRLTNNNKSQLIKREANV
jgi:hypothetical protein